MPILNSVNNDLNPNLARNENNLITKYPIKVRYVQVDGAN